MRFSLDDLHTWGTISQALNFLSRCFTAGVTSRPPDNEAHAWGNIFSNTWALPTVFQRFCNRPYTQEHWTELLNNMAPQRQILPNQSILNGLHSHKRAGRIGGSKQAKALSIRSKQWAHVGHHYQALLHPSGPVCGGMCCRNIWRVLWRHNLTGMSLQELICIQWVVSDRWHWYLCHLHRSRELHREAESRVSDSSGAFIPVLLQGNFCWRFH